MLSQKEIEELASSYDIGARVRTRGPLKPRSEGIRVRQPGQINGREVEYVGVPMEVEWSREGDIYARRARVELVRENHDGIQSREICFSEPALIAGNAIYLNANDTRGKGRQRYSPKALETFDLSLAFDGSRGAKRRLRDLGVR